MGLPCPYLFYSVYSKPSRGFQSHFRHLIVICRDRCHFGYLPVSVVFTGIPVDLDIFPKVQVDLCACVLSNSMDYSLPGSSVHGISQARILERVSISSSRESSWPREQTHISCVGSWILYHLSHLGSPKPCPVWDSNPQPWDSESYALQTELALFPFKCLWD